MDDSKALEKIYKRNLEESIIAYLSEEKEIDMADAMDVYYKSKLAVQIQQNACGIENMDYKYLVNDLIVNEPELFAEMNAGVPGLPDSLTGILSGSCILEDVKD